jgi:SAM-dependent methyltransferase
MLNPGFTADADSAYGSSYVVPTTLTDAIVEANSDFATGAELRTQSAYGDELWHRLRELGLGDLRWEDLDVLDACCGSGFLSYHLLRQARFRSLTLLDVAPEEVASAERLIAQDGAAPAAVTAVCGDLAKADVGQFDVVVGNSFLHHFPDVPEVLDTIFGLVRPGGLFVGLHEPTPAALPLETGDARHVGAFFLARDRYLRRLRHPGPDPVRAGTTDVWIFEADELERLLADRGFTEIRVLPRYLLRPFVVALLGLHLDERRPRLSGFQSSLLRGTVRLDGLLRRLLPKRAFGGVSFVARRPA